MGVRGALEARRAVRVGTALGSGPATAVGPGVMSSRGALTHPGVLGVGGALVVDVDALSAHEFLEVDGMAVEVRTVNAAKARLAIHRDAARPAHAGAVDHDRVERHRGRHAELAGRRGGELHHDRRSHGERVVDLAGFAQLLERVGHQPLHARRAIVGDHHQLLERQRPQLVLEHQQFGVSRAEDDGDCASGSRHRSRDRVGHRGADAAADDGDPPEPFGVSGHAERPDDVGQDVTHLQVSELVRGLADTHEDEADPALLGGPVAEGERYALAALARAHHEELAGPGLGGDPWCFDSQLEDGV